MSVRNIIALILILVSYGLLYPGVTQPILSLSASVSSFGFSFELMDVTRSIWQTVETLYRSDHALVAVLIGFFSVVIPTTKGVMLLTMMALPHAFTRKWLDRIVRAISKWSMADVFVVGLWVTFLSAEATPNINASLHQGFYYFAGYCLVSILSLHFFCVEDLNRTTVPAEAV